MKLIAVLLSLILSALALVAIADNPYGYYQFLRVAVLIISGFIIYLIYQHNKDRRYVWYFVTIALLFNPLLPIYLSRITWSVFDLLVAVSTPVITFLAFQAKKQR